MARTLTLTLARIPSKSFTSTTTKPSSLPISQSIGALARRYFSSHVPKAQLIELDLDSSSSCESDDIHVLGLKKLEDVIHGIIVRRSAPDWLPFRPGSSYWVPPKPRADSIVDLVDTLANPLTEEENLSFTSACGWPSSSFFFEGVAYPNPIPMEVVVQVDVPYDTDKTSECEDEE